MGGSVQLAIQAAVSDAFKTPEVLRLFAKQDRSSLRTHLTNLQTNLKLGKISKADYTQQAVEILTALKKLGEQISAQEEHFLAEHKSQAMSEFDKVSADIGTKGAASILSSAVKDVK